MAVTIYYEQDCNPDIIKDKKIAITGNAYPVHKNKFSYTERRSKLVFYTICYCV